MWLSLPSPPCMMSSPSLPRIVSSPSLEVIRSPFSVPLNATCSAPAKRMVPLGDRMSMVASFHSVSGSSRIGPVVPSLATSKTKSGRENASAGSVATSVLRIISSENELPSSWVSRLRPAVRDR